MAPQELGRKWVLRDADELLEAFNEGFLAETHWCDLKADLGSNRESAKDMSAFSIDGGTIVIGINEKKPNGKPQSPVALKGLPEKLDQIAQMLVHPPLQITCTPIESGDNDGKGYLLVHVPASALAPHQVGGTYYARSDTTTVRMSEPEVERLYQRRAQWNRDASEMLAEHMAVPTTDTGHPQLYVVARPVGGQPDMCRDLVSGKDWRGKVQQLTFNIRHDESILQLLNEAGTHPDYGFCNNLPMLEKTDRGALLSNRVSPSKPVGGLRQDRRLEISEDGEMRLFSNAVHRDMDFNGLQYIGLELVSVVSITRELQAVARYLSNRCGHSSMWDFGLGLDGLTDVRPLPTSFPFHSPDRLSYPGTSYRQTTRASMLELEKTPGAVAERLAGRLYRAFDVTDSRHLAVFVDPTEEADGSL